MQETLSTGHWWDLVAPLARTLSLAPAGLPGDLEHHQVAGPGGEPMLARAALWESPSLLLRLATIEGAGSNIANLALYPLSTRHPLVQVEYVEVRGRVLVALVDCQRLPGEEDATARATLRGMLRVMDAERGQFPPVPDRPEWARGLISARALWTREHSPGLPASMHCVLAGLCREAASLPLPGDASPCPRSLAWRIDFRGRFLLNEPSRPFLARFFGAEWAERFMASALFPPALAQEHSCAA